MAFWLSMVRSKFSITMEVVLTSLLSEILLVGAGNDKYAPTSWPSSKKVPECPSSSLRVIRMKYSWTVLSKNTLGAQISH